MDPISPFLQMGLAMGGVVVCTSLFIWNTIELRATTKLREAVDELTKELAEQRKLTVRLIEEQHKALAEMSDRMVTLAANQLNLTNSINEVVRELIGIVREVDK